MRMFRYAALVVALLLSIASAAGAAPGVALRWDSCYGESPLTTIKSFACDTNAGFDQLVGSFELSDSGMDNVTGNDIVVDLFTTTPFGVPSGAPLPEWWRFVNPGSCRQTALQLAVSIDPPVESCPDWAAGQATGAIGGYLVDLRGPGTARIRMSSGVGLGTPTALAPDVEYFSFVLRIRHDKTVGPGACTGCDVPIMLWFNAIKVVTTVAANDRVMTGPLNGTDSDFVTWRQSPVPTRSSTWAAVKARYR